MEFVGNFISLEEANERERQYTTNNEGCFLLHFGAKMVVDGTRTYGRVGRLVNNGSTNTNSQSPSIVQGLTTSGPCGFTKHPSGEELSFDYGIHLLWVSPGAQVAL